MLRGAANSSPERELSDAQPKLDGCFRSVARRIRTRLMSRSGCDTPVRNAELQSLLVPDLLDLPEVQNGVLWSSYAAGRSGGTGVVIVEGQLLDGLIGRLFGAADTPAMGAYQRRPLTDVEIRVGTRLIDEVYDAMVAAWPIQPPVDLVDRTTTVTRPSTSVLPHTSRIVAATLEFGAEAEPLGRITVALPMSVLRSLGAGPVVAANRPVMTRAANYDRVLPMEIDVVVELARVQATLSSLQALQVGDELPIGPVRDVRAMINGRTTFVGEAGNDGYQRSFRIVRRVEDPGTSG
jgi:flagellar motor switch protein FliM